MITALIMAGVAGAIGYFYGGQIWTWLKTQFGY